MRARSLLLLAASLKSMSEWCWLLDNKERCCVSSVCAAFFATEILLLVLSSVLSFNPLSRNQSALSAMLCFALDEMICCCSRLFGVKSMFVMQLFSIDKRIGYKKCCDIWLICGR